MEDIELVPGTVLLTQNKPVDAVYFLKSGAVKILVNGEMVTQADGTQSFGEMSCLNPALPASATVVTAVASRLFRIRKEDFLNSVSQMTKLWKTLFLQSSERVRSVNIRLTEILNHLPHALVKVSLEGRVSNDYSAQCTEFFQRENLARVQFAELAFPGDEGKQKTWTENLAVLASDNLMSFDELAKFMDAEFTIHNGTEERNYSMTYSPCRNAYGALIAIDIGVEDVTEQKKLKREQQEIQSQQEVLIQISRNPDSFMNFLSLAKEIIKEFQETLMRLMRGKSSVEPASVDRIMRRLHNLKGFAGLFSLSDLKETVHEAETNFSELKEEGASSVNVITHLEQSFQSLRAEVDKVNLIVAGMDPELRRRLFGIVLTQVDFEKLKKLVENKKYDQLRPWLTSIEKVESKKLVELWPAEAKRIAERLGKSIVFETSGEGGRISKDLFMALDKILIHLLRNGVDHGIETPDERIEKGKAEQGLIRATIELSETALLISVSDDGRGIDGAALVERARQNKDLNQQLVEQFSALGTPQKILVLPGFSTADEVTDISGRGVGLDSVASAVEALGGALKIDSELGCGTKFSILIPVE